METKYSILIFYLLILFIVNILGFRFLLKHKSFLKKKNATGERFASQSKPIIGGTMFFVSILFSFIYVILQQNTSLSPEFIALIICSIIAFGMGCVDDFKNFSPLFKLIFQLACGFIFIFSDIHIETSDNIFLNYSLTVFWIVGIMNSINMLDNMDGITASTSLIIFLGLFGIAFYCSNFDSVIVLSTLSVSLLAFLLFNWNPAKMYMGDNGSQLLGIILAYFSIKYVWNSSSSVIGFNYEQIIFICLMFLVPITDTTTVAINRFLAGHSPFVGDRYHTTHCLVYTGFSIPKAVLFLDIFTLIGTTATWYFITQQNAQISIQATILLLLFITVFALSAYILNLIIRKKNNLLGKHE
ncbi:MAG: undecaprenyl/decaprenyl-phosphate alpha-N-acetylglucosaminyl 1-phosphate transferase [Bacteroidales bacterium]|nr:undecaprenyl/decaprenyl-phosphate alpha-N-acetylglucosaminyl 1-phosphate transferase [Bacteroidales bacterium]